MILGVDLASYQGNPDFDQIKGSGRSFVLTKITEGTNYINPYAARARSESHRLGLGFGMYHYARATDPIAEASYFVNTCGPLMTGEVLLLDWEVGSQDPVGWCKAFLDRVRSMTDVKPLIYLNQNLNNNYDWSPIANNDYGLWLAQYDESTNGTVKTDWEFVAIKQYSSTGRVSGIVGNVDLDVFFGDLSAFQKYGKQGGVLTIPAIPDATPKFAPSNDYVVRPGDTLSGVAASHGLSLGQITVLNPQIKNVNAIFPGQPIHLGGGSRPQGATYMVVSGDSMSKIASAHGYPLSHLEAINPSVTNPNLIFPGQILNV